MNFRAVELEGEVSVCKCKLGGLCDDENVDASNFL